MSTYQWIASLGVAFAVATAVARVYTWQRNEKRRAQPIVVVQEKRDLMFGSGIRAWVALARLRNEGQGAAFNVRFGVEYHGVRIPWRDVSDSPPDGTLTRVFRPAEDHEVVPIQLSSEQVAALAAWKGAIGPSRRYWARYENASGDTWETVSPADETTRLTIKRRRFVRLREWLEARERHKRIGPEALASLDSRLRAELEAAAQAAPPVSN